MSWFDKIKEYAPDIVAAVSTGGTSLAVTGLRILGKELLGDENATEEQIVEAAEAATPEQLLAITKANNNFRLEMTKLQVQENNSAREMYSKHNEQADAIADRITKWNVAYILGLVAVNCLIVYFLEENAALVAAASNIIGLVIRDLLSQIQAVTGFYFGSSLGSKSKDSKTK